MEWIEIDINNLPKKEILAANFNPQSYGYGEKLIGYLYVENNIIICTTEESGLQNCTHYIDINQFDLKFK